jgi:hypothetical protein
LDAVMTQYTVRRRNEQGIWRYDVEGTNLGADSHQNDHDTERAILASFRGRMCAPAASFKIVDAP